MAYLTVNEIKNKKYQKALQEMIKILKQMNIPRKRSKYELAKEMIKEIAKKYEISCDVDFWKNRDSENPKNGFQVLNINIPDGDYLYYHLIYNRPDTFSRKDWYVYAYGKICIDN
ncbi:hypothetical protein [Caminibacter sp.]